jgi:hypothetical protein
MIPAGNDVSLRVNFVIMGWRRELRTEEEDYANE